MHIVSFIFIISDQSKIKEAYVIAVEDEAQKRLEKLSSLHKVQPVDMTKLAFESSPNSSFDSGNSIELTPINQTTVTVQTHTTNIDSENVEIAKSNKMEATRKPKVEKRKKNASNHNSDSDSPMIGSVVSMQQSQENISNTNESFSDSMQDSFDQDDGTMHREMAIDCPESFMATVKIPPKYPPSYQNSSESLSKSPHSSPSKSAHQNEDKMVESVIISNGRQNHPLTPEQMDRLHKHQEELRKRREEESRLAREEEFLRTSLRGSKKLQALKEKRQLEPQGVINTAFDNEDFDNLDDGFSSVHGPLERERYMKKNIGKILRFYI